MPNELRITVVTEDRDLKRLPKEAKRAFDKVEREGKQSAKGIEKAWSGLAKSVGAAIAAIGVKELAQSFITAAVNINSLETALDAAVSGLEDVDSAMSFLTDTSEKYGLVLNDQIKGYSGLAASADAAGMSLSQLRGIYLGVVQATTAMQLGTHSAMGALLAIQQMMSKGVVSAEELRNQFGQRIPGSMAIAAKAMGMTEVEFNKLLESGKLLSADFLPKFSRALQEHFGEAALKSSKNAQAAINRFTNVWNKFKEDIGEALLPAFTESIGEIAKALKDPDVQNALNNLAKGVGEVAVTGLKLTKVLDGLVVALGILAGGVIIKMISGLSTIIGSFKLLRSTGGTLITSLLTTTSGAFIQWAGKVGQTIAKLIGFMFRNFKLFFYWVLYEGFQALFEQFSVFDKLVVSLVYTLHRTFVKIKGWFSGSNEEIKKELDELEKKYTDLFILASRYKVPGISTPRFDQKLNLGSDDDGGDGGDGKPKSIEIDLPDIGPLKEAIAEHLRYAQEMMQKKDQLMLEGIELTYGREARAIAELDMAYQKDLENWGHVQSMKEMITENYYKNMEKLQNDYVVANGSTYYRMLAQDEGFWEQKKAFAKDFLRTIGAALKQFAADSKSFGQIMVEVFDQAFQQMSSGIADLIFNWHELKKEYDSTRDMLKDYVGQFLKSVAQMIMQLLIYKTVKDFVGFAAAKGGIAEGGFQAFASGGIVNKPTLGLVGEGKHNEAIVPLPDGKSIPVQMQGGGNTVQNNITVTVQGQAGQSDYEAKKQGEVTARMVEQAMDQWALKNMRPGGLFNQGVA